MKRFILLLSGLLFYFSCAFPQLFSNPVQLQAAQATQKLHHTIMAIMSLYVDEVDETELVENAIVGMLERLDPHSVFIPQDDVRRMNEPLEGNFEGVGIQFQLLMDTLFVVQTISGGPSERVGIMAGDRIISVNDTIIAGVNIRNSDVQGLLRGNAGTTVNVQVLRRGVSGLIDFTIVRDRIPIHSLDAAYMLDYTTGYIRLNRFSATTHNEFLNALLRLKAQGMQNLILDLQGNGGGHLAAAIRLADEFLPRGQLIVYTEGLRHPREVHNATSRGDFETGRLIILIDESSASASEIVSGAVQDWDRGVIVGRRSFGKGLVQRPIPLVGGSQIRLTIARYYTPSGRSIQRPFGEGIRQYNLDLIERFNRGELMHADSIIFPDSLRKETLINRRPVYGGGGIMPDIFVPIDTARFTTYHRVLVNRGIMNRASLNIIDRHRQTLSADYPDFRTFRDNFVLPDKFLYELIELATSEGIEYNEEEFERSRSFISVQMKALLARDLWGVGEHFEIMNRENEALRRALEIINDPEEYYRILRRQPETVTRNRR